MKLSITSLNYKELTKYHPGHILITEESASLCNFYLLPADEFEQIVFQERAAITAAMLTQSSPTSENKLGKGLEANELKQQE